MHCTVCNSNVADAVLIVALFWWGRILVALFSKGPLIAPEPELLALTLTF